MRPTALLACCAAPLLLASSAAALADAGPPVTDAATIDRAVERFTGAPIGVPGGAARPVDRRLRLAPCRAPLALGWHGVRQDSIEVRCPDAGSWRIFVAVAGEGPEGTAAKAEPLVSRGDAVSIVVQGRGFSVSQAGEAMDAGAKGEWIRVRPPSGADPVRAQVERPGLVIIPL